MPSTLYARAFSGVAIAGALTLSAQTAVAHPLLSAELAAPVAAEVQLTALSDGSLMDQFGDMTGIGPLMHILDDPNLPFFPFTIAAEGLGMVFLLIPALLVVGLPLALLTGNADEVQALMGELGTLGSAVQEAFEGVKDWYATHNPFTGALLDPPTDDGGAAAALSPADLPGELVGHDGFTFTLPDAGALGDFSDLAAPIDAVLGDLDLGALL